MIWIDRINAKSIGNCLLIVTLLQVRVRATGIARTCNQMYPHRNLLYTESIEWTMILMKTTMEFVCAKRLNFTEYLKRIRPNEKRRRLIRLIRIPFEIMKAVDQMTTIVSNIRTIFAQEKQQKKKQEEKRNEINRFLTCAVFSREIFFLFAFVVSLLQVVCKQNTSKMNEKVRPQMMPLIEYESTIESICVRTRSNEYLTTHFFSCQNVGNQSQKPIPIWWISLKYSWNFDEIVCNLKLRNATMR